MGLKEKIMYKLMGTTEELENIYKEKGFCGEWVDAFKASHPKMKFMDKFRLADVLNSLERYDEAEALLKEIKIFQITDDLKMAMYYNTLMCTYIGQKRAEDALELFRKHQRFFDTFFSAPLYEKYAIAYYDNAAAVLAMNGEIKGAAQYLELEKKSAQQYDKTGIYPMITYVRMLNLSGDQELAKEEAEQVRRHIEEWTQYRYSWEKDNFMKVLDNALK